MLNQILKRLLHRLCYHQGHLRNQFWRL